MIVQDRLRAELGRLKRQKVENEADAAYLDLRISDTERRLFEIEQQDAE